MSGENTFAFLKSPDSTNSTVGGKCQVTGRRCTAWSSVQADPGPCLALRPRPAQPKCRCSWPTRPAPPGRYEVPVVLMARGWAAEGGLTAGKSRLIRRHPRSEQRREPQRVAGAQRCAPGARASASPCSCTGREALSGSGALHVSGKRGPRPANESQHGGLSSCTG